MATSHNLSAGEQARGRSFIYAGLSRLFLEGVNEALVAFLRSTPGLSAALPAEIDLEEAAAEHYQLFQRDIFPYESFFTQPSGLLGGEKADELLVFYEGIGYHPVTTAHNSDHLGLQLDALAYLCAAEADAWEDVQPGEARRMQNLQLRLLQEHLLCWFVPLQIALAQQETAVYTTAASLLVELLGDQYSRLTQTLLAPPVRFTLPEERNLLDDEKTGLKDIAEFLSKPAKSGVYLTHQQIKALALSLELPKGFGSRRQTLVNLLRTAVQYDALPVLTTRLETIIAAWIDKYEQIRMTAPQFAPFVQPWLDAAARSREMARKIKNQASINILPQR